MARTSQQLNLPYLLAVEQYPVGTTAVPLPTDYDFLLTDIDGLTGGGVSSSVRFQVNGVAAPVGITLGQAPSANELVIGAWRGELLLAKGATLAAIVEGSAIHVAVFGYLLIPATAEILPS